MSNLHHKLPSGRVLLLGVPFTPEELEAANSPEGIEILEHRADLIAKSAKTLTPADDEYERMLARHGIEYTDTP